MKIIFGAIYRRKDAHAGNDQSYDYYIPAARKTEEGKVLYKMVDTHMVSRPYLEKDNMENRLKYLEQANCGETSYKVFFGHQDYFYQNIVRLPNDELNENDWELIADLHDYEMISDRDAKDYLDKDLLKYVPLWDCDTYRYYGYFVGKIYLRKGAKRDGWQCYLHTLRDNEIELTSMWTLNDLEKNCKDILKKMSLGYGKKKIIQNTLKKIKKYRQLSKEYKEFCDKLDSSIRTRRD